MISYSILRGICVVLLLGAGTGAQAQTPRNDAPVADTAPTDQPLNFTNTAAGQELAQFEKLLAPAVKQARKTLPQAKKRFLAGLPAEEAFFLTTRIFDADGAFEQVFIRVRSWSGTTVEGVISNELTVVRQYRPGQRIRFTEKAILDWTITKADGSEEGNFVGKFIDSLSH